MKRDEWVVQCLWSKWSDVTWQDHRTFLTEREMLTCLEERRRSDVHVQWRPLHRTITEEVVEEDECPGSPA